MAKTNGSKRNTTGNSRNRKRGGKNYRKSKEVEINVEEANINRGDMPHVVTGAKSDNDPEWYTHIYPLVSDVASLAFPTPLGSKLNEYGNGNVQVVLEGSGRPTDSKADEFVPGILTLRLAPTIGPTNGPNAPVNIAAQQLYTLVRKVNSGAANYDKTDMMMFILSMDSAYMLYETLLRAYRTLGNYNYMNRYYPDVLLQAQGFSPNLADSLADFRGVLDLFAYQLASIPVPDEFSYIHRHSWLFSNIYKDADSVKAQMYMYVPDGYYVWTEGTDSAPTSLRYVEFADLFNISGAEDLVESLTQIRTAINTIMQPILGSEDIGNIGGDLQKAIDKGALQSRIAIKPVADYESIVPTYNMEVVQQMMNAICYASAVENNNVVQDLSSLTAGPQLQCNPGVSISPVDITCVFPNSDFNYILNTRENDVSPDNVMVYTRLMSMLDNWNQEDGYYTFATVGTEICTQMVMYTMRNNGTFNRTHFATHPLALDVDPSTANANFIIELARLSKFDNHPTIYLWQNGSGNVSYLGHIQDDDNVRIMDVNTLTAINDAAVMSEFAVSSYPTF
nr:putative capsid [Marmot picobirnavirus]